MALWGGDDSSAWDAWADASHQQQPQQQQQQLQQMQPQQLQQLLQHQQLQQQKQLQQLQQQQGQQSMPPAAAGRGQTVFPPGMGAAQLAAAQKLQAVVQQQHAQQQIAAKAASIPPGFADQLRRQMEGMEGHTGKACRFGKSCKSVDCPNIHAEGRDIMDDPESIICRFGRRCMRSGCFYVHPSGRDLDEDPSKGDCIRGAECPQADCIFKHPDSRNPTIQVKCYNCKEAGHVSRECPNPKEHIGFQCHNCKEYGHISKDCPTGAGADRKHVSISDFPSEWIADDDDCLAQLLTSELEVFGPLVRPPDILENAKGKKAIAEFKEAFPARSAVEALNGNIFKIELAGGDALGSPGQTPFSSHERDKSKTVFVGNIPYDGDEESLREIFSAIGRIVSMRIVKDRDSNTVKGYGFVDYESKECALDAIEELTDVEYKGRRLRVTSAERLSGDTRNKGGGKGNDRDGDTNNCTVEISGYPARWVTADVSDFLRGALKEQWPRAMVDVDISMVEAEGDAAAKAVVRFPSNGDARRAWSELKGQKIAGKMLNVSMEGATAGDDDRDNRRGRRDNYQRSDRDDRHREERIPDEVVSLHIDELAMPNRPKMQPLPTDREVFVDPLPDDADMPEWLGICGEAEDVFRIPDPLTGAPGDKGYVKFKEHKSAFECVQSGSATWSESERILCSQAKGENKRKASVYPESMVALILGPKGSSIVAVKEELGARLLSLRGDSLGSSPDETNSSRRVHFVCKGSVESVINLQTVLEKFMDKIMLEMQEKIDGGVTRKRGRSQSRSPSRGGSSTKASIKIAHELIGRLIGKGGETIKIISQDSACRIEIAKDEAAEKAEKRTVLLSGSPESVQKAKDMIEDVMKSSREGRQQRRSSRSRSRGQRPDHVGWRPPGADGLPPPGPWGHPPPGPWGHPPPGPWGHPPPGWGPPPGDPHDPRGPPAWGPPPGGPWGPPPGFYGPPGSFPPPHGHWGPPPGMPPPGGPPPPGFDDEDGPPPGVLHGEGPPPGFHEDGPPGFHQDGPPGFHEDGPPGFHQDGHADFDEGFHQGGPPPSFEDGEHRVPTQPSHPPPGGDWEEPELDWHPEAPSKARGHPPGPPGNFAGGPPRPSARPGPPPERRGDRDRRGRRRDSEPEDRKRDGASTPEMRRRQEQSRQGESYNGRQDRREAKRGKYESQQSDGRGQPGPYDGYHGYG